VTVSERVTFRRARSLIVASLVVCRRSSVRRSSFVVRRSSFVVRRSSIVDRWSLVIVAAAADVVVIRDRIVGCYRGRSRGRSRSRICSFCRIRIRIRCRCRIRCLSWSLWSCWSLLLFLLILGSERLP